MTELERCLDFITASQTALQGQGAVALRRRAPEPGPSVRLEPQLPLREREPRRCGRRLARCRDRPDTRGRRPAPPKSRADRRRGRRPARARLPQARLGLGVRRDHGRRTRSGPTRRYVARRRGRPGRARRSVGGWVESRATDRERGRRPAARRQPPRDGRGRRHEVLRRPRRRADRESTASSTSTTAPGRSRTCSRSSRSATAGWLEQRCHARSRSPERPATTSRS